jgi:uncharacterized protein (TIGR03032 family)
MHVFLIGSPDTGTRLLQSAFACADRVWTLPEDAVVDVPDGDAEVLGPQVRTRLHAALTDREGRRPGEGGTQEVAAVVVSASQLALNARVLAAAFPDARFVRLHENGTAGATDGEVEPHRLRDVAYDRLLDDPRPVLHELCAWLGVRYDQALLAPIERERRRRLAQTDAANPFASVSTDSFAAGLQAVGGSLLVSTYQTGKLICARADGNGVNTHFRDFDKPMGIAVGAGRIALGTRTEVWDLRNMPEVAPKVEPVGRHDACYLPRNRHVTGDIAVHEMAFAQGRLWVVATAFSCLATLDADHSFVPGWVPPFVSAIAPGDRCHLNGLAVVENRVRYVTALGTTDEPRGWKAAKATGGVLMEVPSGEIVAGGLSMPHSPRWHDGALWVLQSGRGELCRVDLDSGVAEPIVELPGFTRGMAIVGRTAFVGLSQIRESSSFGDLPLTHRLPERQSGVWMVDLPRGEITGFLRFDDVVQEIFDVAFLPGARYPEIADATSSAVAQAFALP